MPDRDVLIVHTSQYGHSARIADRLAAVVDPARCEVADVTYQPDVDAFDRSAVIVIGSVHNGRYPEELLSWLETWDATISAGPLFLLSVSLQAARDDGTAAGPVAEYCRALLEAAGGRAQRVAAIGGALQYTSYSRAVRRTLQGVATTLGLSTDVERDSDYCDWARVEEIGAAVAAAVASPRLASAAVS